jgi:hypothetical protein
LLSFYRMVTRLLLIALSFGNAAVLFAQEVLPTAIILVTSREYTKPGKDGTPHQAVEAAYPRSLAVEALQNSTRKGRLSYSAEFEIEVSRELSAR